MFSLQDLFNIGYLGPLKKFTGPVHPKTGKPIIFNKDGSFSTEESMSFEKDGSHYLIPSIYNKQRYSPLNAYHLFRLGLNKPIGIFDTEEEASEYAKQRTHSLGF